jgi:uncharacterized protein
VNAYCSVIETIGVAGCSIQTISNMKFGGGGGGGGGGGAGGRRGGGAGWSGVGVGVRG